MAVAAVPRARFFSRAGSSVGRTIAAAAGKVLSPHKASLLRLLDIPLTVLGVASIDFASFHWHVLGWVVTGVSLVVVEHLIADDDDGSSGRRM